MEENRNQDHKRDVKKGNNFKSRDELKLSDSKSISKLLIDFKVFNIYAKDSDASADTNKDYENRLILPSDDIQECSETSTQSSLNTNTCIVCSEVFLDLLEQRQHFKLDWHRYNLKRKLQGLPMTSEDVFNSLIESNSLDGFNVFGRRDSDASDDADSLSGSETESESQECSVNLNSNLDENSDTENSEITLRHLRHPKIYLKRENTIFSVYKCILSPQTVKDENILESTEHDWINSIYLLPKRLKWAIMMLGGGHFAAAVFDGERVVVHKTFHCYTVRRKQGGGQSGADNKSGTNHPKSAGASLRRYNEASLAQHVKDIIQTWREYLSECHLIFYRAASSNKKVLFGSVTGSNKDKPILLKNDTRVRSIPFPTRRATFKEVKRVHQLLFTVQLYPDTKPLANNTFEFKNSDKVNITPDHCSDTRKHRSNKKDARLKITQHKKTDKNIRRSKSRESPSRPLPKLVQNLADQKSESECSDIPDEGDLHYCTEEFMTKDLQEYDKVPGVKNIKRKRRKDKKKEASSPCTIVSDSNVDPLQDERLGEIMNDLTTSCKAGDQKLLMETILAAQELFPNAEELGMHEVLGNKSVQNILNNGFGDVTTALHIASQSGHKQVIATLLEHGADPTLKDRQKKTPYNLAPDRETRNTFRRFQAKWPNLYNWTNASIPTNDLFTPEEEARQEEKRKEKRRAQRQIKNKKESILKQQKAAIQKEEEERIAFLNLSDREKRALAAERRILASNTTKTADDKTLDATNKLAGLSIQRCYQCGVDITGKTPFEYQNFRFCTTSCVKQHRKTGL